MLSRESHLVEVARDFHVNLVSCGESELSSGLIGYITSLSLIFQVCETTQSATH